jgi:hypothetical protein
MASVGGASGKAEPIKCDTLVLGRTSGRALATNHNPFGWQIGLCDRFGRKQMSSLLDNADHWRACAKEARAVASLMTDPDARRTLLGIAASYDALANHAKMRLASAIGERGP